MIGLKRSRKQKTTRSRKKTGEKPLSTTDRKVETEPKADNYTGVSDMSPESKTNGFPIERTVVGDIN